MKIRRIFLAAMLVLALEGSSLAETDLAVIPGRESVQLTIYKSADLTLVREKRNLTLKKGLNRIELSWADTLIDPTSLDVLPSAHADKIEVTLLSYPPGIRSLGIWEVKSAVEGPVPFEVSYLTSGLSWHAFYEGVLGPDEKTMDLEGYVGIDNHSGEDYENTRIRLIVGKIRLIDRITDLARRPFPFGRPGSGPLLPEKAAVSDKIFEGDRGKAKVLKKAMMARPREIRKEGRSEFFLYDIEGACDIPDGWTKRLRSFKATEIPVESLFKFDEKRFGPKVFQFLRFRNDKAHHLGKTPIPEGVLRVYRDSGRAGHLAYQGRSRLGYIPVGQEVEIPLGESRDVGARVALVDYRTEGYRFDRKGNISGWDEIQTYEIEVRNTRKIPARMEIRRRFPTPAWEIRNSGDFGTFEKEDLKTVKYTLSVPPLAVKRFRYVLTVHHGRRADRITP
ncbi:MAG: DUF4139 domain-containing protein [Deltaproteobacteria bacterium]|nr:DUF4139 domain-containing protein [Deltaproteobacteria bacterium]MBW2129338.1 DUF4139 domain-containing protein [Deltaproteobacteria bacterium]